MFNIFKKKQEEVKTPQYLPLKVREVVKETEDTVTLYFEQPEPFLDYKPGQFLTLVMEFEGKEERRSYSLCTSPFVDPFPGISVKRVPKGRFSNFLNERVFPGKTINVMKPLGNFTTEFHSKNKKHFVLVAAGSGITPIMGILKSVLVNEPNSKISLMYCSRNESKIIFRKELAALVENNPGRLEIIHNLSQPSADWTGMKGRLTKEIIKEFVKKSESEPDFEKEYFACGPEEIMDNVVDVLADLGVPSEKVHRESFYSAAADKAHEDAAHGITGGLLTRDVQVILEGEESSVTVAPDKTILEAGLAQNLNMPYSCQSGLCTACRGRLISGKVKMDEDAGLSPHEIEAGYVLCCVSHPLTDDVKINIE
ncbi:ring-1,2-phenylacetyl-CoA epoxidase subunit PaaE [Algoriphagus ratkowskyi]|uniref:Ferredoxin--NADP reductase n=1 Tax=Algoriphagus ratkowskyi TaxID=57028 RepID=A0A2W7QTW5_9BACT|nr:ferredoxin--NADP reductase [Algoriphagus ratkowskyi]PZX52098.1 ring-1,2-phenylacetyl-CoA epoxidase subunit PaaE [Algoriphagus ratkowskyi]TXD76136.1 ferredoxin--NADP reductase [Algoriphagus ratkowskyi]